MNLILGQKSRTDIWGNTESRSSGETGVENKGRRERKDCTSSGVTERETKNLYGWSKVVVPRT